MHIRNILKINIHQNSAKSKDQGGIGTVIFYPSATVIANNEIHVKKLENAVESIHTSICHYVTS